MSKCNFVEALGPSRQFQLSKSGNVSQEVHSFDFEKGVRWTWFVLALLLAFMLTRIAETKSAVKTLG